MTTQVRLAETDTGIDTWLSATLPRFPETDHDLLQRAVRLVTRQAGEGLLPTGEGALNHAREVAGILANLHMDASSTAAGLVSVLPHLHADALSRLREELGEGVAALVEGVGRMADIQALRGHLDNAKRAPERASQLEALRKMLLAMVQDVRVVIIKLADQTQHLRYLAGRGSEAERRTAARDTADLFAPLANRLGLWQIKWELEDLAFRCLDPDTYRRIARELDEKRTDREQFIAEVTQVLRNALRDAGITAEVAGRPKHIYSIYKKMQRKDLTLKDLYDVRGVRILVEDTKDCYAALGLVHSLWTPLPKEFDDYIAKPKPNNYRSLHTAVVGPNGKVLEVQIRTHEMHRHGELGVAAHWRYKEGGSAGKSRSRQFDDKIAWLRQILDWREGLANVQDLAAHFRNELFDDTVYVLTPQGRVVDLPRGSTPVDFAYHLHSELGHRCRGAKVDGAIVPLNQTLNNGQTVEIISAKVGGPSRDWLNPELKFVASSRARAKVRQWFNAQNLEAALAQGRQWVEKELQRLGLTAINLEDLAHSLSLDAVDDMFLAAGRGDLQPRAFDAAARALREPARPAAESTPEIASSTQVVAKRDAGILVVGVDKLMTALARCCKPIPPDPIVGFVTRGRGVTVHRAQCSNLLKMPSERLMDAQWGPHGAVGKFPVEIEVLAAPDSSALRDVLEVLTKERVPVLAAGTQNRGLQARHHFTVEVADTEALQRLIVLLGNLAAVLEAHRT